MTLTYYVAAIQDEDTSFSLRAKTRKALISELHKAQAVYDSTTHEWIGPCNAFYAPIRKVTITYKDAFDLMKQCSELTILELL